MGRRRIKVKPKKKNTPLQDAMFKLKVFSAILFVIALIFVVGSGGRFTFAEKQMPFAEISITVGLVFGVISAIICAIKKSGKGKADRIVIPICVLLLNSFFIFAFVEFGLMNINHTFGSEEVERYYAEIEDKWRTSKRHGWSYYFEVTVRGEQIKLSVPSYEYRDYDIGDTYVVEYHEGALGVPYYIGIGPVP